MSKSTQLTVNEHKASALEEAADVLNNPDTTFPGGDLKTQVMIIRWLYARAEDIKAGS